MTWKIMRWVGRDVLRSAWVFFYTAFFLSLSVAFFTFFEEPSRILLSLLNLVLMVVPLVSLIFALTYLFNNRNFVLLTLTQPVSRSSVFWGLWGGLGGPLALALLLGMGLPMGFYLVEHPSYVWFALMMLAGAVLLSQIFLGIALWLAFAFEDRLKALAVGLLVWLALTFFYDGLILTVIVLASAYPVEKIAVGLSFLNPLDLVRLLVIMQMDVAALMGFTAAVFKKFLGSVWGSVSAVLALALWMILPTLRASTRFQRRDF